MSSQSDLITDCVLACIAAAASASAASKAWLTADDDVLYNAMAVALDFEREAQVALAIALADDALYNVMADILISADLNLLAHQERCAVCVEALEAARKGVG